MTDWGNVFDDHASLTVSSENLRAVPRRTYAYGECPAGFDPLTMDQHDHLTVDQVLHLKALAAQNGTDDDND
jgi:hypothetical protein